MMLGPRILLVLLVGICLTQVESATLSQLDPIDRLVRQLRATASDSRADPRVLLALRLHSETPDPDTQTILCRIREQAVHEGRSFSSGMLGLYVLALRASCVDPAHVIDPTNTSSIDLVQLLEGKLAAEMKSIVTEAHPVTTYYQVALGLLGLCELRSPVSKMDVQAFSDAVLKGYITQVDTEAVSALALRCLQLGDYKPVDPVRAALDKLSRALVSARTVQHTIGNVYSTGLAAQALIANENLIPPAEWGARDVLEELGALAEQGAFHIPVSASQVLPALLWKSFLDAGWIRCSASGQSGPVTCGLSEISVDYTVTRDLDCLHACSHSITVTVPAGSTILDVMKVAKLKDPGYFKFSTESSAWGEYVVSIGGTEANTRDRTYWQFLVGTRPIPVGVAAYKLSDGDHVVAKFTTY